MWDCPFSLQTLILETLIGIKDVKDIKALKVSKVSIHPIKHKLAAPMALLIMHYNMN